MRARDLVRFGIRALTEKKLRATLTIIGILIGPATIVALEGATQGYSNAATSNFSKVGATTLYVSAIGRGSSITTDDISDMSTLAGVSHVVPYIELGGTVTQGGQSVGVELVGLNFTELEYILPSLALAQGSVPASSDQTGAAVGYSVAYPDFTGATNVSVGQVISVSGIGRSAFGFAIGGGSFASFSGGAPSSGGTSARSFVVEGIYGEYGEGFGINPDDTIFVPLASAELIAGSQTYSGVVVVASSTSAVSGVETELTDLLGSNIRVTSAGSIVSTIESITSGTDTLLLAVGATSVLVAFIGIMTTMLTSVMERTKEIGVLKALGSSSRGILLAFIAEASITGLVGGIIGAGVGFGLSYLVIGFLGTTIAGLGGLGRGGTAAAAPAGAISSFTRGSLASTSLTITPAITPELVAIAILLAVAVGTLGGLLPAWRASRLNPVEALRRS